LDDYDYDHAITTAQSGDVALVFINADSGEQYITVSGNEGDRVNLTAWHGGEELVKAVAGVHQNVVVVIHSVGPVIMEDCES
jgi:beta-glucosidase